MYLPQDLISIVATSRVVWYLYASISGNQPTSHWTTETGVFSDAHCRNLCSTSSTCSEYFYTDTIGSVCLLSSDSSEVLSFTGTFINEFKFGRKFTLDEVTESTHNNTEILFNSMLTEGVTSKLGFYTCYSVVDIEGAEILNTCDEISTSLPLENESKNRAKKTVNPNPTYYSPNCPLGYGASGGPGSICNFCALDAVVQSVYPTLLSCICGAGAVCNEAGQDVGCIPGFHQTSVINFFCAACTVGFYKPGLPTTSVTPIVDTVSNCYPCSSAVANAATCDPKTGVPGYRLLNNNSCKKCRHTSC